MHELGGSVTTMAIDTAIAGVRRRKYETAFESNANDAAIHGTWVMASEL